MKKSHLGPKITFNFKLLILPTVNNFPNAFHLRKKSHAAAEIIHQSNKKVNI